MTIHSATKYLAIICAVLLIAQVEFVRSRKNCKLKKNPHDRTYFLSCDGYRSGNEEGSVEPEIRTSVTKRKKSRRGPPGIQGLPGLPGKNGKEGRAGPEGPMGPIGPTGVPGPRGYGGKPGPEGATGNNGPMGPQGKPGIPGNCLKEAPKYNEKADKYYHCLAGPQGPQGPNGNSGPKGDEGKKGPKGEVGQPGPEGTRGRRGPVGMPGLPGTAARIECQDQYTDWVSQYNSIEAKSVDGFFCPKGQFMQGFKRERDGLKERYHYVCCGLA